MFFFTSATCRMPRRVTIKEKEIFSKFVEAHPHIEQNGLSHKEYEKVCAELNWNPGAVKKHKYVNIDNINRLLFEYKMRENQENEKENDLEHKEDEQTDETNVNESCSCHVCRDRQEWNGKRLYKFADYTYEKQPYVVKFTQEEWQQFCSLDKKGNYLLSKGYAGVVTREMRQTDCECKVCIYSHKKS